MRSDAHFILSESKVLEQYKKMKAIADTVSYSFKTNYEVGKVLESNTKCMFSVHSIQALRKLENKSRAWYFAQGWGKKQISEAIKLGCESFVVDNEPDLNVLIEHIKDADAKINLLLRMRLKEHTVHTGKHFVFGFYTEKINEIMPELSKNSKIKALGIHFHRKTQNVSEWSMKEELESNLGQNTLKSISIVNIGGGLPAKYKNFREEVYNHIFKKIKELRDWLKSKEIEMIVEPGRMIAASPVKLEATIINKYDNNLVVNCSVYNAAMDSFIVHNRLLVDGELERGENFVVKGCTPDSLDIFRYSVYLENPNVGDKIVFLNAGAYNFASDFCQLPKLETVIVE